YLRFSTPEQQKGDSFRRQSQMAIDYAARKGLELDDTLTFHDLGVSSFRGQNVATGKLGYFLEAVESGEVPQGSYLLVESLDRISRQTTRRAQRVLEDIADKGITVVTLNDEREYSSESLDRDPTDLLLSILQFMRANEESATKARRLKEAWRAKRGRLATGTPLTSRVPAWIELDKVAGELRLVPERAAIVERFFTATLAGVGQHQIAADLNREGVQPWGRAKFWQRTYIAKILENEATIGHFTPHTLEHCEGKKVREPQDRIEGYFPAAISLELWNEVQAFRTGKHSRTRGRHANAPITNMLAGMATCPLCGNTMTRVNKGKRGRPSYVCVNAKNSAGCTYKSVRVETVEEAIILRLPERLRHAPAGERNPALDDDLLNLEHEREELGDKIVAILAAIETGGEAGPLVKRLRTLEGQFDKATERLRDLERQIEASAGATVHARIAKLLETLERDEGAIDPAAINLALQTVFKRVTVDYR
ncbi:MAG: recombinase family protein, partial [Verrucomicrobiaceae bacterium]